METNKNFDPKEFEDALIDLDEALELGDTRKVKVILESTRFDANIILNSDQTPLSKASMKNDIDMVLLLLAHNAKPNHPNAPRSPLWIAIDMGHYEVAELLLEAGADLIEYDDDDSQTIILHEAARRCNEKMIELLLNYGADVMERDSRGRTALHEAVDDEDCTLSLINLLLLRGADINAVDNYNVSILHSAIISSNERIIRCLLEKGADIMAKTDLGDDPLHLAVRYCRSPVVALLLSRGADVQQRNLRGRTALHLACLITADKKIDVLVRNRAEPSVRDSMGRTPLILIRKRNSRAARIMVREILKANVLGKDIDKDDIKAIQADTFLRNHHDECMKELELMKTQKVFNYVSFFFIFYKPVTRIVPLVRNESFMRAFAANSINLFPIYGIDLHDKIVKAEKIMKRQVNMESYLDKAFGSLFPALVINKIANFSNPDNFPISD